MQYLIGSLITAVFFALLIGSYYIGTRQRKQTVEPLDDEQRLKQEQLKRDFDSMMNYNVEKAYGGDKR